MRLIVQPQDGVFPVLKAIRKARRSIDVHIFRLDSKEIEKALAAAVARGVVVRTLVAHTNARGEKALRKLEQRLLEIGASVSRTADDLVRYHGKMMVVDGSVLVVMSFNLTKLDLERSRSLGVVTRKRELVQEALRLFAADFDRKPYTGGAKDFLVSPVNARERLAAFLRKAKRQLLVYDESVTDDAMIGILKERKKAGVDLRVIGRVEKGHGLEAEPFPGKRQHLRCIVRDGRAAFVGSQSLRKPELDARREIGVIAKDARLVRAITQVFEEDWARTEAGRKEARKREEASRKGNGRHEAGRQRGSGEESDKSDKRAAAAASA
jgi:phosphatidylserine/phosphatidylglycerophosphate/cardiolipin synthase-like enzyme